AIDDQQLAGAVMKVGSAWVMMVGIAVLFYLWYRTESREQ
ncbi:MAG: cytochrome c oxidase assembly protein, partial [Gemmatimonadetes bacterium]|nr:cytochrome c oxidase assembly protein [Gemmatimonadota bacterium]